MTRNRVIVIFVGIAVLAAIVIFALMLSRQTFLAHQQETDERIVRDVKVYLRQYLGNLPADHQITRLYGQFEDLSFGPYYRRKATRGMVQIQSMLVIKCTAQFERCPKEMTVAVWQGNSRSANGTLDLDLQNVIWGKYRTEVRDSTLYVISEDGNVRRSPNMTIEVTHPDFVPN